MTIACQGKWIIIGAWALLRWSGVTQISRSPIAVGVCQSVGSDSSVHWTPRQIQTCKKKPARQNKKGICFILKNLNKTPVKCNWAVVVHFWLHALLLVLKWSYSPLFWSKNMCVSVVRVVQTRGNAKFRFNVEKCMGRGLTEPLSIRFNRQSRPGNYSKWIPTQAVGP